MKKISAIGALIISFLFTSVNSFAEEPLDSLQQKADRAYEEAVAGRTVEPLQSFEAQLKAQQTNAVYNYWLAYTDLVKTFFYFSIDDKKLAEKEINAGIDLLESNEKKSSDDYALLSYMQSVAINFASGFGVITLSKNSGKNAELAVAADPDNVRAWYARGSLDFNTPKQFGGQKHCEEDLKKALSCPSQTRPSTYLPSWGREESYILLISYYLNGKDSQSARTWYDAGIAEFPDSEDLKAFEGKF